VPAPEPDLSLTGSDRHSESMIAKFNADLMFAREVVKSAEAGELAVPEEPAPAV
jgi:hypothetical protein